MEHQYYNIGNVNARTKGERFREKSNVRSKTSLFARVYDISGYSWEDDLKKFKLFNRLPLTNTHLSGNLVLDNLCRLDKGKLPPQFRADAPGSLACGAIRGRKAVHPSINSERVDAGAGRLPEVGNNIESRQFAWIFFVF